MERIILQWTPILPPAKGFSHFKDPCPIYSKKRKKLCPYGLGECGENPCLFLREKKLRKEKE